MQPLNFIANYYGEKFGFYFAWLLHYTGQLIIPAVFGLIIFLIQLIDKAKNELTWKEALQDRLNIVYAVFIMVWSTMFVESWKRKQNYIGNSWLVREF